MCDGCWLEVFFLVFWMLIGVGFLTNLFVVGVGERGEG